MHNRNKSDGETDGLTLKFEWLRQMILLIFLSLFFLLDWHLNVLSLFIKVMSRTIPQINIGHGFGILKE